MIISPNIGKIAVILSVIPFAAHASDDAETSNVNNQQANLTAIVALVDEIDRIAPPAPKSDFETQEGYQDRVSEEKELLSPQTNLLLNFSYTSAESSNYEYFSLNYHPEIESFVFYLPEGGYYGLSLTDFGDSYVGSNAYGVARNVQKMVIQGFGVKVGGQDNYELLRLRNLLQLADNSRLGRRPMFANSIPCISSNFDLRKFFDKKSLMSVDCSSAIVLEVPREEAQEVAKNLIVRMSLTVPLERSSLTRSNYTTRPRLGFAVEARNEQTTLEGRIDAVEFVDSATNKVLLRQDAVSGVWTEYVDPSLLAEKPQRQGSLRTRKLGVRGGFVELELELVDRTGNCPNYSYQCAAVSNFRVIEQVCRDRRETNLECPVELQPMLRQFVDSMIFDEREVDSMSEPDRLSVVRYRVQFD